MVQTVQIPPAALEGRALPATFDAKARTLEVVWSTGATVRRIGWDGPWDETLSLDPAHVRIGRLNSGKAPVCEAHDTFSLDRVFGTVVEGSVRLTATEGRCTIRLHETDRALELGARIQRGELPNVSVGYRTYAVVRQERDGVDEITAVDWEPFEVSFVPVPADAGAGTRAQGEMNPCRVHGAEGAGDSEDTNMKPKSGPNSGDSRNQPQDPAGGTPPTPTPTPASNADGGEGARGVTPTPAPQPAAPAPSVEETRRQAQEEERQRTAGILECARKAGVPNEFALDLVQRGVPLDQARDQIIDKVAEMRDQTPVHSHVRVGSEDLERRAAAVSRALDARMNGTEIEAGDDARELQGRTLLELGERLLEAQGVSLGGMTPDRRASVILSHRSAMGTTDFPIILGNLQDQTLRRAYEMQERTFEPFTRYGSVRDFKEVKRVQLSEGDGLEVVREGGEIKRGKFGEAKETFSLDTYAKIIPLTRHAFVNDDLGAFDRIPQLMAYKASELEANLVYAQLTSNPTMGDGTALFHADHANIGSGVIGEAGLSAARKALRKQVGVDGVTRINVRGRYLIVPANLETIAQKQVVLETRPNATADANPFQGSLTVIVEPRLDDTSEVQWYVAASHMQLDTIEMIHLEGQRAPFTEVRYGFDVDGMEWKIRHDVAAKVLDHRGFYRSSGS